MQTHLRITRKLVLIAALGWHGLAARSLAAQVADAPKAARPNIIFILSDDYGIAGMGCYGGVYKTPILDKLAAAGTRFEYCFSAPLCAVALSMFGRYGFCTGVIQTSWRGHPQKGASPKCSTSRLRHRQQKWTQLRHFDTRKMVEMGIRWFLIWGIAKKGWTNATGLRTTTTTVAI
jgi:hypothetical protein